MIFNCKIILFQNTSEPSGLLVVNEEDEEEEEKNEVVLVTLGHIYYFAFLRIINNFACCKQINGRSPHCQRCLN